MSVIGVGVIGLGEMGQTHSAIYANLPQTRLVAVFDVDPERTRSIAERYAATACATFADVLAHPDVDAVSICTPDDQHYDAAMQAIDAGKHILLEKPLTTDLGQGRQLVERAAQSPTILMVGHTLRFDPRYYLAKRELADGHIGDAIHAYARRNNLLANARRIGGRTSVAMFLGVHDLDVLMWVMESDLTSVYAVATTKALGDLGVADAIVATLRFASGAIGVLEVSWVLPDHFVAGIDARMEIIGTEGALYVDIHNQGLRVFTHGRLTYPDTTYGPQLHGRPVGIMTDEIAEFIRAVVDGLPSPVPAADGYRAVVAADAIERSVRTGLAVTL